MTNDPDWTGPLKADLDELTAYDAMFNFLVAYWERGLKASDDIAVLLGSLNRTASGPPLDRAVWNDWLKALAAAKANRG